MAASSRAWAAAALAPPQIKNGGLVLLVTLESVKSQVSEHRAEKVHRARGM